MLRPGDAGVGWRPDLAFSLHRLAHEPPDPSWNVSTDTLAGLVNLLVLHEWMREDAELLRLLEAEPAPAGAFSSGCFEHVADLIRRGSIWAGRCAGQQGRRPTRPAWT